MHYGKFVGLDAKGISRIMQNTTGKKWGGIGVCPQAGSGSFDAVLTAVTCQTVNVPVNLDGHAVILKKVAAGTVKYYDPVLAKDGVMSLGDLKSKIRSAALPEDKLKGVKQTASEMIRAKERIKG